jgi:polyhydroxybutyrate depolymerase
MQAHQPRTTRRISLLTMILCLLLTGGALGASPGSMEVAVDPVIEPLAVDYVRVQGLRRAVRFYRPPRMAERPALVLALHGSGGDGERLRRLTNRAFEHIADDKGFLVAYPDALGGQWHDCRARAPYGAALSGVDDVFFLRAVVRQATELAGETFAGVFVVGYSNGGHMVFRAALESPGDFTAFAAIGAHLPVLEECGCVLSATPVSILMVSGTDDPINPWDGDAVRSIDGAVLGSVRSARATADYFRDLVGAPKEPDREQLADRDPGDGTRVESLRWVGEGQREVLLIVVQGGGHSLPHPSARFPAKLVGRTSRDVDGAEMIWSFFARQRTTAGP